MGFINLGRLNIRKSDGCSDVSDVQPPSVYKSHILNGPINLLSAKQISTVPNLQRHDDDVQTTLQRCVMALNAPMKLAHLMF